MVDISTRPGCIVKGALDAQVATGTARELFVDEAAMLAAPTNITRTMAF